MTSGGACFGRPSVSTAAITMSSGHGALRQLASLSRVASCIDCRSFMAVSRAVLGIADMLCSL